VITPATGRDLRDEGIRQLELVSTFDDWPDRAFRVIAHLADTGRPFTAEHLRELVGDPAPPGLMGTASRRAATAGPITSVGVEVAERRERAPAWFECGGGCNDWSLTIYER
jgi:hypothetical protein